ncbi:GntR family transcriptional regulator [Mesoterricola sediminis]|uniref:GntR family transcriptional regulator n=1 Tax=Mesoterricola sediminis TaxID=2927980 RepID=A0AA48GV41_9BACT|nr:GntR family transcriptional regulator [Mesoterricola sediminis]BDU78177.1 GntR family transcriptional regulator [Mesoterricola sediminis]
MSPAPDAPRPIDARPLREQVYDHLKAEIRRGAFASGSFLDLNRLARDLGVSRTPLRDALLQLEAEEFVTISPRRGVSIRTLEPRDIREIYQLVGALEAAALLAAAPGITPADLDRLRELDRGCARAVADGDPDAYREHNYAFHDFFLERQGNRRIIALVHLKKHQLYDWTRRAERIHVPWEERGILEHEEILRLLEAGSPAEAAAHLRDVHWGFEAQEPFVRQVYFP